MKRVKMSGEFFREGKMVGFDLRLSQTTRHFPVRCVIHGGALPEEGEKTHRPSASKTMLKSLSVALELALKDFDL